MEIKELIHFLNKLEEKKIYYKLDKIREESILVEIVVPGQRWEVEFMEDSSIEIEKFISDRDDLYDERELDVLFRDFSDSSFQARDDSQIK